MWNSHLSEWIYSNLSFWRISQISHIFYFFITETFGIPDVQDIQLIYIALLVTTATSQTAFKVISVPEAWYLKVFTAQNLH